MPRKQQEQNIIITPAFTDLDFKNLEKELNDYREHHKLENDLSYYGQPVEFNADGSRRTEEEVREIGKCINPIIGGAHWSVVEYCLEKRIIGKKNDTWFIVAEELERREGGKCITHAWTEFWEKWNGLKAIQDRRVYGKKMDRINLDKLESLKVGVGKEIDDENFKIEDLPF